jgi:hypothetical protein
MMMLTIMMLLLLLLLLLMLLLDFVIAVAAVHPASTAPIAAALPPLAAAATHIGAAPAGAHCCTVTFLDWLTDAAATTGLSLLLLSLTFNSLQLLYFLPCCYSSLFFNFLLLLLMCCFCPSDWINVAAEEGACDQLLLVRRVASFSCCLPLHFPSACCNLLVLLLYCCLQHSVGIQQ